MVLLSSCSYTDTGTVNNSNIISSEISSSNSDANSMSDNNESKLKKVMEGMTLKEKIGQLFIVRPEALDPNLTAKQVEDTYKYGITKYSKQLAQTLAEYPVGGIAMFGKNIDSPKQITELISDLQKASKLSLFISVDEEGGKVSRIANSDAFNEKKYDSMEAIGKTGNSANAKEVGSTIGKYLKKYGFNLDFAPDSDINTNPKNIVIGDRSFGSNPSLVAKMVSAEIEGLHSQGMMSCIKHFPGHGDTTGDTHKGFVGINKTWEQLKKAEIIPFEAGIAAKTDMVMVSHITAKNITGNDLPSSLSKTMITDKLRNELKYGGVIITDSMAMGAIAQNYSSEEAAVLSIQSGIDIILMPEDYKEAFDGIYNAVKSGKITESRIDESVARVLKLKEKYSLL